MTPTTIRPDSKADVSLQISGNFPPAATSVYPPALQLMKDGKAVQTYSCASITNNKLTFIVPRSDLTAIVNPMVLHTDYPSQVLGSRKHCSFPLSILVTHEKGPGSVHVQIDWTVQDSETKEFDTQEWQQHSSNDDFDENLYGPLHDQPWFVVPGSEQFIVHWSEGRQGPSNEFGKNGDWWCCPITSGGQRVGYHVRTEHHRSGTSGKINFRYHYRLQRNFTRQDSRSDTFDLAWGASHVVNLPAALQNPHWKIVLLTSDGLRQETSTTAIRLPGINIAQGSDSLTIQAHNL